MNWCESLYWYAQERGGEFFGGAAAYSDGILRTEYRGLSVLVSMVMEGPKGGAYGRAAVQADLQTPYRLYIGGKNVLIKGVKIAAEQIFRGLDRLTGEKDTAPAWKIAFPEVTRSRYMEDSHSVFTKTVLGDLEFRNALLENPSFSVAIGPSAQNVRLHAVEARATVNHLHCELGASEWGYLPTEPTLSQENRGNPKFGETVDRLIALAYAAQRAVTAWPMPEKT